MKKFKKSTHRISFQKDGIVHTQDCFGKTDLLNCLRQMMKDGFTFFTIRELK